MISLFSIPKPFAGHIGVIQDNALRSWRRLAGCEVILLGNDAGVGDAAQRHGARWIPDVAVNEFGTPLLNSAFERARAAATRPLLCYVNADILLLDDLPAAARGLRQRRFLMLGQRWDLDLREPFDFQAADAEARLRARVREQGVLHPPSGSDYFLFPKDCGLAQLPAFAVGRPTWDNWFIFRARQLGIPVIDATHDVTVVHQNHDYGHVRERRGSAWEGPEGDRNRELTGGYERVFTLADATHRLADGRVRRAWDRASLRRRWEALPILSVRARKVFNLARRIRRALARWIGAGAPA